LSRGAAVRAGQGSGCAQGNEDGCRVDRLNSVTDNSLRKGLALKGARDRAAGRRFGLVKVRAMRKEEGALVGHGQYMWRFMLLWGTPLLCGDGERHHIGLCCTICTARYFPTDCITGSSGQLGYSKNMWFF